MSSMFGHIWTSTVSCRLGLGANFHNLRSRNLPMHTDAGNFVHPTFPQLPVFAKRLKGWFFGTLSLHQYPKDSNDVKIVNETAPALPTPPAPPAPAPSPSSEAGQHAALLETIQRNKAAALDARHISAWPQRAAYQQIAIDRHLVFG